jgi:hypothetical protein
MSKVYANGRTVVHQGDGQVNTDALPDVCKTPSPGGPVPIPYVNVARDGDLANGSTSVSIEGHPVALKDSNLSTSSGDEPGTAGGGLISSKTKGKMTWASASIDVKIEGQGVIRFLDATQHNGNTFNTSFINPGSGTTAWAYGDDQPCTNCKKPSAQHPTLHENNQTKSLASALSAKLESKYQELELRRQNLKQEKEHHDSEAKKAKERGTKAQKDLASFDREQGWKKGGQRPEGLGEEDWNHLCERRETLRSEISKEESKEKYHRLRSQALVDEGKKLELPSKFMIGVLQCEDDSFYGAMSGVTELSQLEFNECARSVQLIPCGSIQQVHTNQGTTLSALAGEGQGISPLSCAAIKLLEKAQGDGKTPKYMTEQLFSTRRKEYLTDGYLRTDDKGARQVTDQHPEGKFTHGQTVPSCGNCQLNIPRMLCPESST